MACRRLIAEGLASSAHDCSDGGLAVALAECCIVGGIGLRADLPVSGRWDAALFGEDQSRIVVSLSSALMERLAEICAAEGVQWVRLGTTGGDSLAIGDLIDVSIEELEDAWGNAIERALAQS